MRIRKSRDKVRKQKTNLYHTNWEEAHFVLHPNIVHAKHVCVDWFSFEKCRSGNHFQTAVSRFLARRQNDFIAWRMRKRYARQSGNGRCKCRLMELSEGKLWRLPKTLSCTRNITTPQLNCPMLRTWGARGWQFVFILNNLSISSFLTLNTEGAGTSDSSKG